MLVTQLVWMNKKNINKNNETLGDEMNRNNAFNTTNQNTLNEILENKKSRGEVEKELNSF
jgi:hypothetical protein